MAMKVKKARGPWPKTSYCVGLDLGQSADSTALTILEKCVEPIDDWSSLKPVEVRETLNLRHCERFPLNMPYPDQAQRVTDILQRPPLSHPTVRNEAFAQYLQRARPGEPDLPQRTRLNAAPTRLVVDSTGLGKPVVDLFRQAGLKPIAVVITAGRNVTRNGNDWYCPKLTLVSHLQSALHSGKLRIAKDLPEAQALADELQDFRASYTPAGNPQFEARTGKHDDMVLSLALATFFLADQPTFSRRPLRL
jgi:hypothetical protein